MKRYPVILILLTLVFMGCQKKSITLEDLLLEITDREALANFPDPEFSLAQFSSYDRATVQPGNPLWFANWDRTMFIRTDTIDGRTEYVMFDAEGPGAIVRFWMTFAGENSGKGTMRIYFDHQDQPVIEGTAMEILSGNLLVGEPLASSVSDSTQYEMRGHNLYLPLPYQVHCKVTYESENIKDPGAKTGGEAVYYNINYRTYGDDADIKSFTMDDLGTYAPVIEKVQQDLLGRSRGLDKLHKESLHLSGIVQPGESLDRTISGERAVRMLKVKVSPDVNPQSLRSTILEMSFDGNRTVWSPLGDFFGTGYQLRYSNTWYTSVDVDGTMVSYWVMPFRKNVEIKLVNSGTEPIEIQDLEIVTAPWAWNHRSMHFGSSWHQFTELATGEMKNNEGKGDPFDINYVTLEGKGVYAGDAITLFNTVYAWWGEGDEKIYVDGESFPSHIGTGTEDYYGYAWCRPEKFANHPFIAQPDGSGNFWPGYTINLRHRGLDGIPFNSSLKVDMEMWHWTRATINFAPVTFWYVIPGGKTNIEPDHEGALAPVVIKREELISPVIKDSKMEAESMILKSVDGNFRYQNSVTAGWSDNMQAFWTDGKPGDKLELAFISEVDGLFDMKAHFNYARDYGSFDLSVNGIQVGSTVNLRKDEVSTGLVSMGRVSLKKGENILTVKVKGTSPVDNKAFFGLDYLNFE